ncbi:hypothetical protein G3M48_000322 [Beauveria asiatica]|uniref:Uncharacterized protein n=1 Tax=Beauveria asiatica TaxID=1069075 RepID=A0AAW0RGX3_9HYPO
MISDEAAVIDNLDNQDISDQEFDDLMQSLEEDNADEQSDDETPALSKGKGKAKPKKKSSKANESTEAAAFKVRVKDVVLRVPGFEVHWASVAYILVLSLATRQKSANGAPKHSTHNTKVQKGKAGDRNRLIPWGQRPPFPAWSRPTPRARPSSSRSSRACSRSALTTLKRSTNAFRTIPKARIETLFKNGKLDDPNGELVRALAEGKHLNEPLPADQRELIMKMLTEFAGERKEYDAFRSTGSGLAEASVAHIAQEVATGDEVQSAEHVTRVMAIKGDEAARAKVAQHTLDTWRAGFTTDIPYTQAYAFMKMRGDADNKHNTSQPVSHTWRVRIT